MHKKTQKKYCVPMHAPSLSRRYIQSPMTSHRLEMKTYHSIYLTILLTYTRTSYNIIEIRFGDTSGWLNQRIKQLG